MQATTFLVGVAAAFALLGVAFASPGHKSGHGHDERAYGEPGDPRKPARTVQVTMREADGRMLFVPDRIAIRRGEQIRFVLRNDGALDHEIVLATLAENLEHARLMAKNPDM